MAKVNKLRTARKALLRGAQYAAVAVAALAAVPVPEDVGVSDQATVVFGLAVIGAVAKAIQNYHKTKKRPVKLGSTSGYILVLLGLSLGLAGCVTTTAPDGTVTQSLDPVALDTAWGAWERLERRKALLEAEREEARRRNDAEMVRIVDEQLRRLAPELDAAARRLGVVSP